MQRSENVDELMKALAKAQGEMKLAAKSQKNPHFRSSYSDISDIIDVIREPFAKNSLAYFQCPVFSQEVKAWVLRSEIHLGAQFISNEVPIWIEKQSAQGFGSALTYARRYGLQALACVGSKEEDDDGEGASGRFQEHGDEGPAIDRRVQDGGIKMSDPYAPQSRNTVPMPIIKPKEPKEWRAEQRHMDELYALSKRPGAVNLWTPVQILEYMKNKYGTSLLGELKKEQYGELFMTIRDKSVSVANSEFKLKEAPSKEIEEHDPHFADDIEAGLNG